MRFKLATERVDDLKEFIIRKVRFQKLAYDEFWALRDISFSVRRGESVALIGSNGSGKSTMLKIISGILVPTRGSITVNGSTAPLIELGAGFDAQLTGRENIFLNGAILGRSKRLMQEKYDEIVDFSELKDFIDVPVKNYSSGMVARLGFSIATIVKPQILIVDEILAVGDQAFQAKCRKRMEELMTGGTTVVLVSHAASDVERICSKAVWIEKGELRFQGAVKDALALYNQKDAEPVHHDAPHKVFVARSSMPPLGEYVDEVRDLWESRWLTNMGAKHELLRQRLKTYLGVPNVELLVNGHMALEFSLQALKLEGEVITTPFTFASTTHAILRNGLVPVFCDIDPFDFTLDAEKIERLVTKKTCAIVPVHVYGHVCHVEEIERIAKKYGLYVIYDAAHAFGVRYRGKGIAAYGDVACFSFHATKVYHTIEGGAVCFNEKSVGSDFGTDIYRLKNFGIRGPEVVDAVGANAKMNEFCAAMGLCNLRHFQEEIDRRKKIVELYRSYFQDVEGVRISPCQDGVETNYSYFPVVFDAARFGLDRDEVAERLATQEIYARKYFYPLTNAFDVFRGVYDPDKTPIAKRVSENVLVLPLYADLSIGDAKRIAETVLSCKRI